MAVSNSIDFTMSAADLVKDARSLLGIDADEEPMEASDLVYGLQRLNMMLKAWQIDSVMCWTMTEGQLTLVQGDADYVFGAGGTFTTVPLEVTDVRINRGGNDLPMFRLSREDYFALPNKTTQGYPTQFYYDRQRSGGTMYVWPAPDATAGTLKFTYRRIIMDVDGAADDLDLTQEWYQAISENLAVKLMPKYGGAGTPEGKLLIASAERSFQTVKGFDIGEGIGSLSIVPAGYG